MLKLMLITNDVHIAKEAESAGVDRVFVDLERNGKLERQGHLDTHIGDHTVEDVGKIKKVLTNGKVLVRINPFHDGTQDEVNSCIKEGADIIMLPMFKTKYEVEQFIEYVNGRAEVSLLLETAQALVRVNEITQVEGINEIHIGLNDLHLSLGLDFMFELLSGGIVEYLAKIFKRNNIRFGFGGIAKVGEGLLPAELVITEHVRLNSQIAILSRAFHGKAKSLQELRNSISLEREIGRIREVEAQAKKYSSEELINNQMKVKNIIDEIRNQLVDLNTK